jgi:titin
VNAVGTSPQSNEAAGLPAATAPSAPQSVVTTAGNASVAVAWSAPTTDGGSPVTGYNVYRGTVANGESSTPVASGLTTTGFTDTGLTNATTYFYKVAAVNSVGASVLSTESSATPQAPQATSYVRRIGSATASTASSSSVFAVGPLGVAAGHTVVIASLLSSTSITGAVSATDSAGNSYVLARDVNDGSAGDRVVTLIALSVKAVSAGGTITFTHPSSGETQAAVDEYAGATAIDTSAGASATGSAFSSGSSPVTSQGNELLIGVLGTESGSSPTWSTGWTALPALAVSTDYLGTAYRIVTTTGSYAASGTSGGQWMAGLVSLKAGAVTATAPSSPQGVTATAGNTTVQLSWTPPTSTGGSPITGYNIYRGTAANAEASTPIASNLTTTSYTDTALTNATTYYYKITALNSIGPSAPSAETSATPQAAPTGSGFVRRVGSTTAAAATTTNTLTVGSPGVAGGHTLVISMLLSSTSVTATVSAQDTNGNTYVIARDVNDGSAGDRTVLMVAVSVKALTAGMSITVSHSSAAEVHLTADEYAGVTGLDTSAGATASTASFSSGNTPATSQANELLIGVVGLESGKTPVWSTGWTALAPLSVSSDYLGTAYRTVTASGTYAATGTSGGQWMAGIVALKTG